MVLMLLHGYPRTEIASLFGCHPRTVRRWAVRYQEEGIEGLRDRPRAGRPRLGGHALRGRLLRLLVKPRPWTVGRPRLAVKGDPEEAAKIAAIHRQLAELPEGAVLLVEDETKIELLAGLRSAWVLRCKGWRQQVMTPGQNRWRHLFGALEPATGRWFYRAVTKLNSETFIEFLEEVIAAYPTAPAVAVLMDNLSVHCSRKVREWLASQDRVRLLYGARYCPHHNPVERIWGTLKAFLANSPAATIDARLRQVDGFFRLRSPDQLLRTAAPFSSPWLAHREGQDFGRAA
jgi:transposase/transposase-like protein